MGNAFGTLRIPQCRDECGILMWVALWVGIWTVGTVLVGKFAGKNFPTGMLLADFGVPVRM
jgi:hypothetical protein